jgi:DNA polymerase delta subunit 1
VVGTRFQKAVLDGLQLAYKITANSLYGQLGASTSPLYCQPLASSTTATGQKMIMLAKEFVEKQYEANVVYGDTDSIFIAFPKQLQCDGVKLDGKDALKKSIELGIEASEKIKPLLKAPHDLEFEKCFFPIVQQEKVLCQ